MDHVKNFYRTILGSSHPLVLSVHLSGKAAPIVFYVIGSWFLSFTMQFITVLLLLATDFYLTKNINGRKLVQLRWWYNSSGADNKTFTFESYKQYPPGPPINPIDSRLFWWSTYVTPVVWIVFGVMCLLQFKFLYLILVAMAICLTGWNAYGFRNCDKWEPNQDGNQSGSWIQMPSLPAFNNLSRLAGLQSFFQSN
ncbi:LAFE_0H10506g1_1 [Lachancea fermentati]|uniref:Golgi apparatus membrane protein TVP23 n=1 Tax=Lachancea fermentati TaxID=4955 RepID=A0A1G4MK92_LACFM|nr:LAFE_0H10506g1_1 [Lachancea fermentati]